MYRDCSVRRIALGSRLKMRDRSVVFVLSTQLPTQLGSGGNDFSGTKIDG